MDYTINTAQEKVLIEKASQQLNDRLIDELVAIRKEMDLTQQDISDKTGINRANVARIENKYLSNMQTVSTRIYELVWWIVNKKRRIWDNLNSSFFLLHKYNSQQKA